MRLFGRFGPKVALTAAGRELLNEGRYLLRAAGDLESRVRRVASGWETELTIGMDSMLAPSGLQPDIEAFYEVADQTRLRLVSEVLSGTWDALLDRRVDLLVGAAGEGPSGGGYTAEPLGVSRFVFAVAPGQPPSIARWKRPTCWTTARSPYRIRRASSVRAPSACCSARTCWRCRTWGPSSPSSCAVSASVSCPSPGPGPPSRLAFWWKRS